MSKICHEHCPTGEGGSWFWLVVLVAAAAAAVWLVGELLSGLSKTHMAVIGGTAFAAVGLVLVVAVGAAVRNHAVDTTVPAPVLAETQSRAVPEQTTPPRTPDESAASDARGTVPSAGRPRLRLVRGGRAA
jgi:hypothetical protein